MRAFLYLGLWGVALFAATPFRAQAAPEIPVELSQVGITEKLGERVDLGLQFKDEAGNLVPLRQVVDGRKPTVLFIVYYSCPNLCNFFLNGALETLKKLSLTPGRDFNILTVSMDPREGSELAAQKKENYLKAYGRDGAGAGWRFWVNETQLTQLPEDMHLAMPKNPERLKSVRALADQVGFRYRYEKTDGQFAHTAAMVVLTPEGIISRYLYGISFQPRDLRLSLVEASDGKVGNAMDRLLLFCYHYDPKSRKYALFATNLMRLASILTVVIVALGLGVLIARDRRRTLAARRDKSLSQSRDV